MIIGKFRDTFSNVSYSFLLISFTEQSHSHFFFAAINFFNTFAANNMFKKILIYFLVVCSVSNGAMQLVVYSGYKMNKEYITSVFCINKEHPELHCDGQCFLAKKLKDLDSKNKQVQENLKRIVEAEPKFHHTTINHQLSYFIIKQESGYLEKPIKDLSVSIFHPPKTV